MVTQQPYFWSSELSRNPANMKTECIAFKTTWTQQIEAELIMTKKLVCTQLVIIMKTELNKFLEKIWNCLIEFINILIYS